MLTPANKSPACCLRVPAEVFTVQRQAEDKGTRLIDEDGLISLIKASIPFVKDGPSHAANGSAAPAGVCCFTDVDSP